MKTNLSRREFLSCLAVVPGLAAVSCRSWRSGVGVKASHPARFFFVTQGKTAMMNFDGTGLRHFDFKAPNQVTWQPAGFFSDGRRVLFLSMEARRDGPGRPFEEYYTQTPTHIWVYDLERDTLTELATQERLAVFYTPELLLNDQRLLVQVVRNKVGQIFNMNLDGTDAREFTRAGEGLPYGTSLSPDGQRVAFHLASPSGYQIWTSDLEGRNRALIAGHRDHLYFGPRWSPNGEWLAYLDCHFRQDPGHDSADICVSRPDGSGSRVLPVNHPSTLNFQRSTLNFQQSDPLNVERWALNVERFPILRGSWPRFASKIWRFSLPMNLGGARVPSSPDLLWRSRMPGLDPHRSRAQPATENQRVLTQGQPHWFAATYGRPGRRGSGSNMLAWTRDGAILFSRKLPGSKVPWEFQAQRKDTDHFNRDYRPELARGGTEICRLDPRDGEVCRLTHSEPPVWDCRASESPDGRWILFCRAETGRMPEIWVMRSDGSNPRRLTAGIDDFGADHPRWLPSA